MLGGIIESLKDLRHFAPGPQVHAEAGQSAACRQANNTVTTHTRTHVQIHHLNKPLTFGIVHYPVTVVRKSLSLSLPKAASVERLAALQARSQVLEVIRELLVLSELHHVVEVLHVLHHCI